MSHIRALANSVTNKSRIPLILFTPILQYIIHFRDGRMPEENGWWKHCSLLFSTFIFHIQETHFSPLLSNAVILSLTCAVESMGSTQKGQQDAPRCIQRGKKRLMQVWCPPPDLPECEWTYVNRRQTYTNAPAAIGVWRSVWATANKKQQHEGKKKSHWMPGFPLIFPHPHQSGGSSAAGGRLKGWAVDKNSPGRNGGIHWPCIGLIGCKKSHIAINTYSTKHAEGSKKGYIQISTYKNHSTTKRSKSTHCLRPGCSRWLNSSVFLSHSSSSFHPEESA